MTNLSKDMQRYESMLFDNTTITRTDFRTPRFVPEIPTTYKAKGSCYRIRPPPLKNLHCMSDWRVPNVPSDMLWKYDPILRRDPNKVQEPFTEPQDLEIKEVRKTRPRLVMTPAISLDDFKEDSDRDLLTSYIYTSTAMNDNRDMAATLKKVSLTKAPLPGPLACALPVTLPKVKPNYVSPEWRMETVSWEGKQLRCCPETTAEFWLRRANSKS